MKYDQIAELLNSIAERFEWEKVMEGDKIIGLKQVKHLPQLLHFDINDSISFVVSGETKHFT